MAEQWFIRIRWPTGVHCPKCGSSNVRADCKHPTMPFRCREKVCGRRFFSTKTGTVMEGSELSYQDWIIAMFLVTTNLKGVASMKLRRDLDVTQKTSWFFAQRLRGALSQNGAVAYNGPVEVDTSDVGSKRKDVSKSVREQLTGPGPLGMTAVVGVNDRWANQLAAKVYTDVHGSFEGMKFEPASVKHSLREYVTSDVYDNGIESLWPMLNRAHKATFDKMSPTHLGHYVQAFTGRHNMCGKDTVDQFVTMRERMECKRLTYKALIRDNGLASGARA